MQFVEKYTITLPKNKLEYYKTWKDNDVFKSIHVPFELEGNQLKQVSGGNPLDKYNKTDINTVIGEDGYLDQLHKVGIYHGDIITGVFNKEKEKYDDLKINVGNILKNDNGEIKLIDFGPIDENEKRTHDELMRIEKKMLEQVRKEGVTKTHSPERIRNTDLTYEEKQEKRKRDNEYDDDIFGYYSGSDSDVSLPSPPKMRRTNQPSGSKGFAVRGNLFGAFDGGKDGGKKNRRRTKKKRRRKRKSTKKKRKRKRKSTKKKRRKRR